MCQPPCVLFCTILFCTTKINVKTECSSDGHPHKLEGNSNITWPKFSSNIHFLGTYWIVLTLHSCINGFTSLRMVKGVLGMLFLLVCGVSCACEGWSLFAMTRIGGQTLRPKTGRINCNSFLMLRTSVPSFSWFCCAYCLSYCL
jgi:hypothetical protein